MSLIINGMKMPKKYICIILNPNGLVEVLDANNILLEEYQAFPVPPHGDLIDRNAVAGVIHDLWAYGGRSFTQHDLDSIPTIIPAEEVREKYIHRTNADKFRSMNDEELAEYFRTHASLCPDLEENKTVCKGANFMADDKMCRQCWLNWLKQDAQMNIY